MLLVAIAVLAGSTIQSTTGFGFALVISPALLAILEPEEAIATALLLGASLSVLVLFTERRERQVCQPELMMLFAGALPGLALGVLIIQALEKPVLQIIAGAAIVTAALLQIAQVRRGEVTRPRTGAGPIAAVFGLVTGTLTTTTSTNGPPMVLFFQRIGASPAELRDSLAAAFITLDVIGAAVLFALSWNDASPDAGMLALLLALTVVGHAAGRRLFTRLDPVTFRTAGLALVMIAGVASLVVGIGSL